MRKHLVGWLGPFAFWLRGYWVFTIGTALGAIFLGMVAQRVFIDSATGQNPAHITALALASAISLAVFAFLDKVADAYDSAKSKDDVAKVEDAAEAKVSDLNGFIQQCARVSAMNHAQATQHVDTLRALLTAAAASGLSSGSRATYYTLSGKQGRRVLGDPQHAITGGRADQPDREFLEWETPENTIWTLIERSDTETELVKAEDPRDGVNWAKVKYRAYYTVPARARGKTYGALSVNTAESDSMSGAQCAAILSMAKVYAFALAVTESKARRPRKSPTKSSELSVAGRTFESDETEEGE